MLPDALRDPDRKKITDDAVKRWHSQLLENLRIIPGDQLPYGNQDQYNLKSNLQ